MSEQVQIIVQKLTAQVEGGMKKKELADFYNITVNQMGAALKAANLKIRKFHTPKFVLVSEDDIANTLRESPEQEDLAIAPNVVNETKTEEILNEDLSEISSEKGSIWEG